MQYFKKHPLQLVFSFMLLASTSANAAVPNGYYSSVDTTNAQTLHSSLHEIIDDHQRFPYSSSSTDTWDILEAADQDPDSANSVIDVYKNASYTKAGGGNTFYNREHSWPKSYGFPNDGSTNYPYTDTHHLFIADSGYNSSRNNKPYDNCDSGCSEKTTLLSNNRGGGVNDSNWTTGSGSTGSWETWQGRRGDVARALMYLAVRYEGGIHSVTGVSEPDLRLTDDRSLIGASNVGANISVAYMGLKSVLLQWHKEDPVDAYEFRHNETVYSFQGNRNPFVDHPEYVACVFEANCSMGGSDSIPPGMPTDMNATGGTGLVELAWTANIEQDLAGYNIYRSDSSGGSYVKLNSSLVTTSAYTDSGLSPDTTYFYVVTAVDSANNESTQSSEAFVTTDAGTGAIEDKAWINEFHYDNANTDIDEFVEIAGTAGLDLSGWSLLAYNGNSGAVYKTISLSGIIVDHQAGLGTISFATSGLQNGAPDGLALVDSVGKLVQFISYEGSFAATDGAAVGTTSIDVGVAETTSTPLGYSLQLSGLGASYSDFSWQNAAVSTSGGLNNGQNFGSSVPVNQTPTASFTANCNSLFCDFDASASTDPDGSITTFSWSLGEGGVASGITPNYNYNADGSYSVTLTVTDNDGATASSSLTVTVERVVITPWINEFHYDNSGSDSGEFVEIAASAGTDLSGWKIEVYNGGDSAVYGTFELTGVIANQQNGLGTLAFDTVGLQNGGPDGIALIDASGNLVQFISYEGTMTAANGAASGTVSTDVGVEEGSSTTVGYSLQLSGTGKAYGDFNWNPPAASTKGALNNNQSF